jgi:hypothetical protein
MFLICLCMGSGVFAEFLNCLFVFDTAVMSWALLGRFESNSCLLFACGCNKGRLYQQLVMRVK